MENLTISSGPTLLRLDPDSPQARSRLSWDSRGGLLTSLAMDGLRKAFAGLEPRHEPSAEQWEALYAACASMEEAVNGRLEAKTYLSSVDCGVGKTSAVVEFVNALLSRPEYVYVGVLICVSRLVEIEALVKRAGIAKDQFAVFSSDTTLNALGVGKENAEEAQVLFVTQESLQRLTKGRTFSMTRPLYYGGHPRELRIWDEAISFGKAVSINDLEISALLRRFASSSVVLDRLNSLLDSIKAANDGDTVEVPSFETALPLNEVHRRLSDNEEDRLLSSGLWALSGKVATVRKEGNNRRATVDYEETLPHDLNPIIALDASGRVRATYKLWEESRKNLVRLPAAKKTYGNLTCHVWQRGGSKTAWKNDEFELAEGIAKLIDARPKEPTLVVVHKPKFGYDPEKSIKGAIKGPQSHVRFINWGAHESSNDYSDCSTVILAGTLFYSPGIVEGLTRAAKGLTSSQGAVSYADRRAVELGESRHNLFQAAARGSLRRSRGHGCAPCELFVIASARSGIPAALSSIFPGSKPKRWKPSLRTLKGTAKEAFEALMDELKTAKPDEMVKFGVVQKRIGVKDRSNFKRLVRFNEDFLSELAEHGIIEVSSRPGGYPQGWAYVDGPEFEDDTVEQPLEDYDF